MGPEASEDETSGLRGQARDILQALQSLEQEFGAYLDHLATIDWTTLATQGQLAGTPKFLLERTLTDARNVLTTGQNDLTEMLQDTQEPADGFHERLQALIRLYTDTPIDIHHRCQRLTAWMGKINRALQHDGQPPLTPP